jgi:acyl-CoA reductase-like NAD-dependent aldehyde dehydrogenase
VGDPLDKNTDLGAINSKGPARQDPRAVAASASGGRDALPAAVRAAERGFWFPPTLFTGVTQSHRIAREEIFGPVLSILTFRTVDEAIEKANNTPYGLSAGVWTDKGSRILRMSTELKAGVVWANTFNKFDPSSPFGGYKESGFGREGGRQGLESRRAELAEHVALAEGLKERSAAAQVSLAIDRIVWYAGWCDKVTQVLGGANPVAGPFFNFSLPTPSGVVAVIAPQDSSLVGFVDTVLAPIVVGNTVVALASERRPTPAVLLGEMSVTSDFPAGLLNIVTGITAELAPTVATHEDIDGLDLEGVDHDVANDLAALGAESIKRVLRPRAKGEGSPLARLRAFVETSTVWHTIGQ